MRMRVNRAEPGPHTAGAAAPEVKCHVSSRLQIAINQHLIILARSPPSSLSLSRRQSSAANLLGSASAHVRVTLFFNLLIIRRCPPCPATLPLLAKTGIPSGAHLLSYFFFGDWHLATSQMPSGSGGHRTSLKLKSRK